MREVMEMEGVKSFLDFVRYCIDEQQCVPTIKSWNALYQFMQQQALVGIGFRGLERMKAAGVEVPRDIVLQWYAMSAQIKRRNVEMNKKCVELTEMLKKDGFESCILKGQGNAVMYGNLNHNLNANYGHAGCGVRAEESLELLRMPGDIDVWVKPVDEVGKRRKVVMEYVRKRFPDAKADYQHVDYPIFPDTEVEMHYIPIAMNNPWYNRRIQHWMEERMDEQCQHLVRLPDGVGQIAVPTTEFNIVYQMSHLMHHFFDEGVGLRQMMDYYYLLRKAKDESEKLIVKSEKFFDENSGLKSGNLNAGHVGSESLESTLRYLNLYKFAGAVMWVLHEVFGLEEKYMIAPMDEWRGKLLLEEILKGGNFGHYSGLTDHSVGTKYFLKIKRNMRFAHAYPSEALCEPLFRTWHFFWRVLVKFRV